MPNTRAEASLQAAKASGKISSNVSPFAKRSFNAGVCACNSESDIALYLSSNASTWSQIGCMRFSSRLL